MGHNNDATNGFGTASGTWAAPTTNDATQGWSTSSDGTAALSGTTTTTTNDTLYFGTDADGLAAGTVTVSGTVEAGHLYFGTNSGAITLSGGTITLGGAAPSITVNNASNTISSILAGSSGWTKEGSGTLTLTAVNTYSGITTINAGTVELTAGNTIAGGAGNGVVINAGATLRSTGGNNRVNAGIGSFSIDGGTWDTGTGNQVMNNSANGAMTMNNGTITGTGLLFWWKSGYVLTGTNTIDTIIDARLGDNSGLFDVVSGTTTLSKAFRGMRDLRKDGAGTLILSAVNTNNTNALVISNGVLEIGGAGQLNSGAFAADITNNATFSYNSSANQTLSGVISGSGGLIQSGAGTLTLTGSNTFSGATTVSAGRLVVNGTNASSAVTVQSGGTLSGSGQVGSLSVAGLLAPGNSIGTIASGSTTFQTNGSFQLELNDWSGSAGTGWDLLAVTGDLTLSNTSANPFVIDLVSMSDGTTPGLSINWNENADWTNTFVTYSGSLLGETFAANLFSVSTNNFQNTINGTFTVTNVSGGLALLYTTAFDPGVAYVWNAGSGDWSTGGNWTNGSAPTNGSLLVFSGAAGTATNNSAVSSASGVVFSNTTGSITLDGSALSLAAGGIDNASTNAHTINNGLTITANLSITVSSNNLTIAGNITNDTASQQLTFNGPENTAVSGVISGVGLLAKNGGGTLTLTGANTYSGGTVVNGGVLSGDANGLQGSITNDASVVFDQSADGTYAGVMSGTGAMAKTGAGTLTLSGTNTYSGGTTVDGGTLVLPGLNNIAGSLTVDGSAVVRATRDANNNFTLLNGTITLQNGGTFVDEAISKVQSVEATVVFSNGGEFTATSSGHISWGNFAFKGGVQTTGTGSGLISAEAVSFWSGNQMLTVGSGADLTISSAINNVYGTSTLTKDGAGTLFLTGDSAVQRTWIISAGAVEIGGTGRLGSGSYTGDITNAGTFSYNSSADQTMSGVISGAGNLIKSGAGTLTLTGANTYSGGTVVNSGVLSGDANGLQGSITNDASVVFDQSANGTYAGVMSGAGAMTKTGAGTLTLSAANTHTGTTTVDAGTLELSTGSAIGSGGSILVNAGAVLRSTAALAVSPNIASFIINGGTYDLASNQNITNGTAITMSNATITGSSPLLWVTGGYVGNGTNTISQIIDARSGAGDYSGLFNIVSGTTTVDSMFRTFNYFVKDGAGTLVLSAVNTNAVSTALVISNGVLEIGGAGQLNSGSYAGDIANDGTFTYNSSADQTLSGAISGAGNLTKGNTGTLTLSGSNNFTGALSVSGGTLALNSGAGGAASAVASVTVSSGATLLVSQSNQVNNAATVTLSGGTISRGSGVSEVFGNLNLTTGSFLDFGTGATGNLTFGTYQNNETPSVLLTLNNFLPGNSFTFESSSFTEGNITNYFSFGTGYVNSSISNTGSTFTITAIPEPSTLVAAALLLGLGAWPAAGRMWQRRTRRDC